MAIAGGRVKVSRGGTARRGERDWCYLLRGCCSAGTAIGIVLGSGGTVPVSAIRPRQSGRSPLREGGVVVSNCRRIVMWIDRILGGTGGASELAAHGPVVLEDLNLPLV